MVSEANRRHVFRQCSCGELYRGAQFYKHRKPDPQLHKQVVVIYACIKCRIVKNDQQTKEEFHSLHIKCKEDTKNFKSCEDFMRIIQPLLHQNAVEKLQQVEDTNPHLTVSGLPPSPPPVDSAELSSAVHFLTEIMASDRMEAMTVANS